MSDTPTLWTNDRNFNEESVTTQRGYYVVEHNDLITKARQDLNAQELKIMDYVISKIKPEDAEFHLIDTSMYEICNVLDLKRSGRTYSQVATNLNNLRKKDIFIYDDEERSVTMTGWFESVKVWEKGRVELRINKDFAPYLLELKDNYTQHLLVDTVLLTSKYAIMLYKLMREADKSYGTRMSVLKGSPKEIKDLMGAPKSYSFNSLKTQVLEVAIRQINENIPDMDLEMFTAYRGRSVDLIEIHNNYFNPKRKVN